MSDEQIQAFAERAIELKLMGFRKNEWQEIVADQFGVIPTQEEFEQIEMTIKAALREFHVEADLANEDLNLYLRRSSWIQEQLLNIFNNMLRNYNALVEGKIEHDPDPDGNIAPVLPVKPNEIAAMGEKILKLDQERLAAQMSYPHALQKAQHALAITKQEAYNLSDGGYAALTDQLWDDPEEDEDPVDADYEEA